ncbi:MAG: class A beta-lactamase-related serine hydrolase [Hydrotalea sp.]|nr:class A beta-lactamase-related serine hydrolase [Hydrotalea sp.]
MKKTLILFCWVLPFVVFSQKADPGLLKKVQETIQGFRGVVGVQVLDIKKNTITSIHADTVFPTASIVKIPILIGVMDKIEKGELEYHQKLVYKDSLFYAGEDILGSFKHNESIELSKVLMLMLTTSDNTASLWLQGLVGTGSAINKLMDSLGLPNTKVNSRTPGREDARKEFGWGQTTPREMAELMRMIVEKKVVSPSASEKMLRLLGRNYWDEEALGEIPAGVFTASKNGAVNASRSEVVYVNHPKRPYIFCIITKNNIDQSWKKENEAWEMTRRLSRVFWNHFNK